MSSGRHYLTLAAKCVDLVDIMLGVVRHIHRGGALYELGLVEEVVLLLLIEILGPDLLIGFDLVKQSGGEMGWVSRNSGDFTSEESLHYNQRRI